MPKEFVILVDEDDNQIGLEEKVKCHLPDGKLHRAFTALLFDPSGRLLLTLRSRDKMLWPNNWDGTVASHPRESETYESSAERRLPEELGISCKLEYMFKFAYHVPYRTIGSENEICGTLIGKINANTKLDPVEGEITDSRWITPKELLQEIQSTPRNFCPWMLIAVYLMSNSDMRVPGVRLEKWNNAQLQEALRWSISMHLPASDWGTYTE